MHFFCLYHQQSIASFCNINSTKLQLLRISFLSKIVTIILLLFFILLDTTNFLKQRNLFFLICFFFRSLYYICVCRHFLFFSLFFSFYVFTRIHLNLLNYKMDFSESFINEWSEKVTWNDLIRPYYVLKKHSTRVLLKDYLGLFQLLHFWGFFFLAI